MNKFTAALAVIGWYLLVIGAGFGSVALLAAIFYFGVPFVTGFAALGFWQYFVAVILILVIVGIFRRSGDR